MDLRKLKKLIDLVEDSSISELEITEGTVMDSPQKAIDIMLQIRAMGIHLSLDDFGTGYSSLAYLKKFPLNTLKSPNYRQLAPAFLDYLFYV